MEGITTYFVVGDTHGDIYKAEQAFRDLPEEPDMIIHTGDYKSDGEVLGQHLGKEVIAVQGNMDSSSLQGDFRVLDTAWGKIFITHGHAEIAKRGPEILLSKAYSNGYRAVLYGHTHRPLFEEVGGIYLLNPGSIALPVGGKQGSYALLRIGPDSFEASIFYLQEDGSASQESDRRPRGRLYSILNNSDRF